MKRHPSLQTFSRDHFDGLNHAKALAGAAAGSPADRRAALDGFRSAWEGVIRSHFAEEEELLLPVAGAASPLGGRLLREHADLRAAVAAVLAEPDPPDPAPLERVGRLLHDHIRWEERDLFPWIEAHAPAATLAAIGERLAAIERTRPDADRRGPRSRKGG